ncbi:MAG: type II secretion system protein GspM, partial [Rubrivivax sp.]
MSSQAASGIHPLRQRLAPARAWWHGLPPRERRMVVVAASVLGLYLLWVLALSPALQTARSAPRELDGLDAQWQTMQAMAAEAAELRAAPPINRQAATAALQAATGRLGESGKLTLQGDRAVLT